MNVPVLEALGSHTEAINELQSRVNRMVEQYGESVRTYLNVSDTALGTEVSAYAVVQVLENRTLVSDVVAPDAVDRAIRTSLDEIRFNLETFLKNYSEASDGQSTLFSGRSTPFAPRSNARRPRRRP